MGDCDVDVLRRVRTHARNSFYSGGSHYTLSVVDVFLPDARALLAIAPRFQSPYADWSHV